MSSWKVTPPSNSSEPWARSWISWSLARRSASLSGIGPRPSPYPLPRWGRGKRSHALEGAVGGHGGEGLLVARQGAGHVLVGVHGGDPAVLARAIHAVVEEGAAQELGEIPPPRAVEAPPARGPPQGDREGPPPAAPG